MGNEYLKAFSKTREQSHELTPFLKFALKGIALQCQRLLRDAMARMYGRLQSTRKRALAHQQCEMLSILLDSETPIEYRDLYKLLAKDYDGLQEPMHAFVRDLNVLAALGTTLVLKEGPRIGEIHG